MATILNKVKNAKLWYYVRNIIRQGIPILFYQQALSRKLRSIKNYNPGAIADRVNYYNKLDKASELGPAAITLGNMPIFKSPKAYNFDTFEYTRYFDKNFKANFLVGDITHVAKEPSIQKSRPIFGDNRNAVLLKLDKKRHFVFLEDSIPFTSKKDILVGRGVISQPHRKRFMEMYFGNPMCDLGDVNKRPYNTAWSKPKLSIQEHLQYKFILSLEGNDVATNLKWIMSTNSIAVMPKPKYETWFMEGRLIPGYHYIEIKDDYSDLEQQLNYYIANADAAQAIIVNANEYVKQFLNKQQEGLIALLVLQKYFKYTSQI
ncbi:lipopolysaccharide biosynthesis protein [Mucilaginibacter sp. ZT4R22]|uniref:Lipopolysaccharide biosynthesis protein n=1 Tax=Mucilaginibacter pankratovii TaxID=2772110 RepID=A0ABR7WRC2_9SPHI|nr:glycosyl transferase family 90 [Mucilaginibacter pankratovii]MBD1364776.1 lipopolysaccharide biosynthesis protein [Mucilaginibacter pankratovii]